jgi:RimJ/RimL family protein N-acetyltransferase
MAMEATLDDGTRVAIRPIRPDDKLELAAGLRRLSDESVQRRFLAPKTRFSQSELRYLTEVDGHDHVALVAERLDGSGDERAAGVARFVRLPEDPETAEMAIVVTDALQGRGLGSLLADALAEAALAHGVRRFSATVLSENYAVQRLLSRISRKLERSGHSRGQQELLAELSAA